MLVVCMNIYGQLRYLFGVKQILCETCACHEEVKRCSVCVIKMATRLDMLGPELSEIALVPVILFLKMSTKAVWESKIQLVGFLKLATTSYH